jgi:hypothetical protein
MAKSIDARTQELGSAALLLSRWFKLADAGSHRISGVDMALARRIQLRCLGCLSALCIRLIHSLVHIHTACCLRRQ